MSTGTDSTAGQSRMVSVGADSSKFKVFVSSCDADTEFVDKLVEGLEGKGQLELSIDRSPIVRDDDWKSQISTLIADADTVVFVISPGSAQSEFCLWEVEYAHELSKRIVPVLHRPLGKLNAPIQVATRKPINFDKERSLENGLEKLVASLGANAGWLRMHTQLFVRARAWQEAGKPQNLTLTGADIAAAKAWTFDRPMDAPKPTDLHMAFIGASETAHSVPTETGPTLEADHAEPEAPAQLALEKERTPSRSEVAKPAREHDEVDPQVKPAQARPPERSVPEKTRPWIGPSILHAVLGTLLLALITAAGWQALETRKQVAQLSNRATVKHPSADAPAKHLFLAQSKRIEETLKTVECLLLDESEKGSGCTGRDR